MRKAKVVLGLPELRLLHEGKPVTIRIPGTVEIEVTLSNIARGEMFRAKDGSLSRQMEDIGI